MDDDAKYKNLTNLVDKVRQCPHISVHQNKKKYFDSTQYFPREYITDNHFTTEPHANAIYNFSQIFITSDKSAPVQPSQKKTQSLNTDPVNCSCISKLALLQHFDINSSEYFMYPISKLCDITTMTELKSTEISDMSSMMPLSKDLPEYMLNPDMKEANKPKNVAMKVIKQSSKCKQIENKFKRKSKSSLIMLEKMVNMLDDYKNEDEVALEIIKILENYYTKLDEGERDVIKGIVNTNQREKSKIIKKPVKQDINSLLTTDEYILLNKNDISGI